MRSSGGAGSKQLPQALPEHRGEEPWVAATPASTRPAASAASRRITPPQRLPAAASSAPRARSPLAPAFQTAGTPGARPPQPPCPAAPAAQRGHAWHAWQAHRQAGGRRRSRGHGGARTTRRPRALTCRAPGPPPPQRATHQTQNTHLWAQEDELQLWVVAREAEQVLHGHAAVDCVHEHIELVLPTKKGRGGGGREGRRDSEVMGCSGTGDCVATSNARVELALPNRGGRQRGSKG